MERIQFRLNGKACELEVEKNWTLLHILRDIYHLTGTKCGCATGDCGTCTVVMNGEAVRSCLINFKKLNGSDVLTIEGLSDGERLHPIQQAFVEAGAVQCGFCTPGMIMAAKALLDHNPDPTEEEVRLALEHNLCRCTGYEQIVEAVLLAAERLRGAK
ncbi:MAG: (2Fe-2S)-binding protein [Lachnospiraceae bacterium]|nr:(2Fe-2S)-binding protein [Lachnospiraceae bacterium]